MTKTNQLFVLDPGHTFAYFEYCHFGFSRQISRFDKLSGVIKLNLKSQNGSVNIEIDTRSVNTGSELFNSHIQGIEFLNTSEYPKATFVSDKVEFEGSKVTAVHGVLTIKDICEHVTLEVIHFEYGKHPITGKEHFGANAVAVIQRSDFNMGKYSPQISDEVVIKVAIEASKGE
ncbi:YceI family protein [Polynucleobacter sp. MWH-UH23A]|uniref:YceI family protein n=1 Tax=Polynucleobacter sp. MWH-UH23A TaxID=1855613 RepID=UPI003364D8B3